MRLAQSIPYRLGDELSLLAAVEGRPAVFALFFSDNVDGGVPYLSRTRDLRRRLARLLNESSGTSKRLNLRAITHRIEFQYVGSTFEAQWLLYLLNRKFYPRLYRQRLRLKPPALLKINLRNRFPRCYPTRRLAHDGSLYYGPFPSRASAERFAGEFLDLFKIRRCVETLHPDPSHPGCIYSQMKMCLAPCFAGCADDEYQRELGRVVSFLDAAGQPLIESLRDERDRASGALDFESAERAHRKIEKVNEVLRSRPVLVSNLGRLNALIVLPGVAPRTVAFFRLAGCELRGPAMLLLDENVPQPEPLDQQLDRLAASLAPAASPSACGIQSPDAVRRYEESASSFSHAGAPPSSRHSDPTVAGEESALPRRPRSQAASASWEHLALVSRWYYSSHREGDLMMLTPGGALPHRQLIRLCRKLVEGDSTPHPCS
jgi:hypothetical protein